MNLSPSRVTPLVVDHVRRVGRASAGFRSVGLAWTRPWLSYLWSPLLNRIQRQGVLRFEGFDVRLGKADLYTFANLFEDYPVSLVRRALAEVSLVLDLGANVGAFSWLITHLSKAENLRPRIVALEPNAENASFLRAQPFAAALEIDEAAVGPVAGMGTLVPGENSVTDHVDYSGRSAGATVPIRSFDSLCDRPALVKMDIEGGEREILQQGLPEQVRHLFLEWHPLRSGGTPDPSTPADLVAGNWMKVSSDPYGSSMWYFRR